MGQAGTVLAPGATGGHWPALETLPGQSLPGSGKFWDVNVFPSVLLHISRTLHNPQSVTSFRPIDTDSGGTRPLFASRLTGFG